MKEMDAGDKGVIKDVTNRKGHTGWEGKQGCLF